MKKQRVIAGILITVIVAAGYLVGCVREVSFEEAVKKPEVRDNYITKIVKKIGKPDYVVEINYVDTPEEFDFLKRFHGFTPEPMTLMVTNPTKEIPIGQLGKQLLPVRISIFPDSFSGGILKTENDFISSLLHEYHHAKALNQGKIDLIDFKGFLIVEGKFKGQWDLSLIQVVLELTGIRETIHSSLKISPEYREQRFKLYLEYYAKIWDYEEGMNPEFMKSLKIEFFEDWMLERLQLYKEKQNGKEIWYLRHRVTGKKYCLPDEIITKFQNGKD